MSYGESMTQRKGRMMTGDETDNDRIIGENTVAPGSVPHKALATDEPYEPETDSSAARKGPTENWMFWSQQINAALIHERRWRVEAEAAEILYFGEDVDPGETGSADAGERNRVSEETSLIHANIDVLKPMLFSETPQPIVRRRYRGDGKADETDLMAAEVGQRLAMYLLDTEPFDSCMENVRDDWLITDRGSAHVAYVATVEEIEMPDPESGIPMMMKIKTSERVVPRYTQWRRLTLCPGATWEEMPWVARETPMTYMRLVERFGKEKADRFNFKSRGLVGRSTAIDPDEYRADLRTTPEGETGEPAINPFDTAMVWEIWNRESREVIWWSPAYTSDVLDKEDDPLGLEGFFPMPKPILGTAKGEQFTPRPSIKYYERRAKEVDLASKKLKSILNTLSVSGLFPGQMQDEVKKLLDGTNSMIPVASWINLMEKGGSNNIIQWLPLQHMVQAINALIVLREQAKAAMFEASGVSDIMRAQGDPSETATAQQLKGRYAGLRLSERQKKMAQYALDMLRLMIEVALEHFDTEYIADICGLDLPMTEVDREMLIAQQQMVQQQYEELSQMHAMMAKAIEAGQMQGPIPPPPAKPKQEHIPEASWELVHDRLRTDYGRKITLTIETQSTILADEATDKEARVEFLGAFSTFVNELAPLASTGQFDYKTIKELLLFGIRGFPKSRTLEGLIASLPDEPEQKEPVEDPAVTIAKIRAEVDIQIQKMKNEDGEADRQNDLKLKGVNLLEQAATVAGEGQKQPIPTTP